MNIKHILQTVQAVSNAQAPRNLARTVTGLAVRTGVRAGDALSDAVGSDVAGKLQQIRDLAVAGASDNLSDSERSRIGREFAALTNL